MIRFNSYSFNFFLIFFNSIIKFSFIVITSPFNLPFLNIVVFFREIVPEARKRQLLPSKNGVGNWQISICQSDKGSDGVGVVNQSDLYVLGLLLLTQCFEMIIYAF